MPPRKAKAMARVRAAAPKAAAAKSTPSSLAKINISLTPLSHLLGLTRQRVNQLERDGWIQKAGRNDYALVASVQGYLRFLRDEDRRSTKSAEAARVQSARARQIELRNAREEGRLIDIDELDEWMQWALGAFRSNLLGLPAASTRDLVLRAKIEQQLQNALAGIEKDFHDAAARCNRGKPVSLLEGIN